MEDTKKTPETENKEPVVAEEQGGVAEVAGEEQAAVAEEEVKDAAMPTEEDASPAEAEQEAQADEAEADSSEDDKKSLRRRNDNNRRKKGGSMRRARKGRERPRPEFETRVLSARRVSRVVAGGRRFSLSVAVAVGNQKGKVGIGTGKGQDMASATEKARNKAQKRLIQIPLTPTNGISSEAIGKHCASIVEIRPGKSFIAGGAVRTIAELAGIQAINAKILSRSKSHLNNARATMKALSLIKD